MRNSLRSGRAILAAALLVMVPAAPLLAQTVPDASVKKTLRAMEPFHSSRQVIVKFVAGRKIRLSPQGLVGLTSGESGAFASALRSASVSTAAVRRMAAQPEKDLDLRANTAARFGRVIDDGNLFFVIDLPAGADAAALANRLNALAVVEYAEPAPRPAPLT